MKHHHLYQPYKGTGDERRAARTRILEGIEKLAPMSIPTSELRSAILDNPDGDALDSVVAAFAVFSNLDRLTVEAKPAYALEGYVYK